MYVYYYIYIQMKTRQTSKKQKVQPSPRPKAPARPRLAAPFRRPLASPFSRDQLQAQFLRLLGPQDLAAWLPKRPRGYYQRLFSPLIILWYFVLARLQDGATLQDVVQDAHWGGADALCPPGKPLSQRLKSWLTAGWCKARQRLPLDLFYRALNTQAQTVRGWVQNLTWKQFHVFLLDGSTIRLRPFGNIPTVFPPHPSRRPKRAYWCLMRVVVCLCAATGTVLGTALGATSLSEQNLACSLILQALPHSLFVGDRNFGIFRIVQAVVQARAQLLVRLTEVRARKLAAGPRLRPGLDRPVCWSPSPHDQVLPDTPAQPVAGRLIVVRVHPKGFRAQTLYLFTTLLDPQVYPVQELLKLYGVRWQIELHLRSLKSEMNLRVLECKSADLARKEWIAGLLAYNLVRAVMVAAAVQAQRSVFDLSFRATQKLLLEYLDHTALGSHQPAQGWRILMAGLIACRLPRRRKSRPPEPRAKRPFGEAVPTLYGSRAAARKKLAALPPTKRHAKS